MSSMMMNMNNVDHSSLPIFVFFFWGTFFSPPVFPVFGFFLFFSSFAVVRFFFSLGVYLGVAGVCVLCLSYRIRPSSMHTRVREFRNPHPPSRASPFGRINPEPSHATASTHRSPHSVRVRVRVRVRVGWSASGATAKIPRHIYVPGTIYMVPGI